MARTNPMKIKGGAGPSRSSAGEPHNRVVAKGTHSNRSKATVATHGLSRSPVTGSGLAYAKVR